MSHYTTELRFICENYAGLTESKGYNNVDDIIEQSREHIFSFDYPIFDENYKPVLETKIIRHFYTREICAETVGRWKLFLQAEMNEIMPYYNKLYESELLQFNPLHDVDLDETGSNEGSKTNSGTLTGTNGNTRQTDGEINTTVQDSGTDRTVENSQDVNDHWDYYSDTPQGTVGNLQNLTYLTDARHITDDTDGSNRDRTLTYGKKTETDGTNSETVVDNGNKSETTTGNATSTEEYLRHISGKRGGESYSKLLEQYRETFLNIDMMIIQSLDDCFMQIW